MTDTLLSNGLYRRVDVLDDRSDTDGAVQWTGGVFEWAEARSDDGELLSREPRWLGDGPWRLTRTSSESEEDVAALVDAMYQRYLDHGDVTYRAATLQDHRDDGHARVRSVVNRWRRAHHSAEQENVLLRRGVQLERLARLADRGDYTMTPDETAELDRLDQIAQWFGALRDAAKQAHADVDAAGTEADIAAVLDGMSKPTHPDEM